jgi:hypothetical protein
MTWTVGPFVQHPVLSVVILHRNTSAVAFYLQFCTTPYFCAVHQ